MSAAACSVGVADLPVRQKSAPTWPPGSPARPHGMAPAVPRRGAARGRARVKGPAAGRGPPPPAAGGAGRALGLLNKATKWGVSFTAFGVLLARRDVDVCWCLLGSIVSAANCKAIKRAINAPRPDGAYKADPGMPSSHAQSLAFLASYTAAANLEGQGFSPAAWTQAGGLLALAAFLTWLRVATGLHTVEQVGAGFALGLGSAALWHALGLRWVLGPEADAAAAAAVYALTAVAVCFFGYELFRKWLPEVGT